MTKESFKRAELTLGLSEDAIYESIERQLAACDIPRGAVLVDVGCGRGYLGARLSHRFDRWVGVDLVRHEHYPPDREIILHDLDQPGIPLPDESADVVIACEVTPCLENPWVLLRECARLCRPGGWVIVHNPNLLSFFSLVTLLVRGRYRLFQEASAAYMITPILEGDLVRMFTNAGLTDARVFYTERGRLPFGGHYFPKWLARSFPRLCSDHLGVIGRKPTPGKPQAR
jgi:2-polyprenyl-3-methyl-5-hydroxy-6-metoxy-1,4-benzoquinol methylase